eukprot:gene4237-32184_t
MAGWVAAIPPAAELRHAAFWNDSDAECLHARRDAALRAAGQFAVCGAHPTLASCWRWAWATLRQRGWGEEDDRQFGLQPRPRSLAVYGYVDHATDHLPDLGLQARLGVVVGNIPDSMTEGHPLKGCIGPAAKHAHAASGQSSDAQRRCWAECLHLAQHAHGSWGDAQRKAHKKWRRDKRLQARSAYEVQEALRASAAALKEEVSRPRPEHCAGTVNGRRATSAASMAAAAFGN